MPQGLQGVIQAMIDLPHELGADSYAASVEKDRLQIKLNRHAISFAAEAAAEYEMPEEALLKIGRINGAAEANGEKHNAEYAAHLDGLAEEYTALDAADAADYRFSFYRSGLFMPGAVLLQPALYIRCLADGLAKSWSDNFQLFEYSPALSFARSGGCWQVKTPNGSVTPAYHSGCQWPCGIPLGFLRTG